MSQLPLIIDLVDDLLCDEQVIYIEVNSTPYRLINIEPVDGMAIDAVALSYITPQNSSTYTHAVAKWTVSHELLEEFQLVPHGSGWLIRRS